MARVQAKQGRVADWHQISGLTKLSMNHTVEKQSRASPDRHLCGAQQDTVSSPGSASCSSLAPVPSGVDCGARQQNKVPK